MASPRESYYPAVCVRACARLCRIVSNVVNKSELGCVWRREYQFGMMRPQRNDGDSGRLTSAAPSAGRANGQSFPISSFLYSFSSSSFLQMRPLLPCAQSVGKYSLAMRAGLPALSFFLSLSLSLGWEAKRVRKENLPTRFSPSFLSGVTLLARQSRLGCQTKRWKLKILARMT